MTIKKNKIQISVGVKRLCFSDFTTKFLVTNYLGYFSSLMEVLFNLYVTGMLQGIS